VDSEDTKLLITNSPLDHISVAEVVACCVTLTMPIKLDEINNNVVTAIDSNGAVLAALGMS
jgi:hypothetical protein